MSAPLPILPDSNRDSWDSLVAELLRQQANLTAVERFAEWHDRVDDKESDFESHYSALLPTTVPASGEQYAFQVDLDACSGCKACVVACHNLNSLEESETWRKVGWLTSHTPELPIVQHVTTACHHCLEPACLSGCPVVAYEKDPLTGIVRHLDDQCFGCKYCTMMCPYEVPQYSSTLGIVRKCDMCSQRLSLGEVPACVQACPNEAIRIAIVQSASIRQTCSSDTETLVPTAPPSHITFPTTQYTSQRRGVNTPTLASEALLDHPHEGHWPLVGMLVLTQASVGIWCVLSLVLLSAQIGYEPFAGMSEMSSFGFVAGPEKDGWLGLNEVGPEALAACMAAVLAIVGVHLALLHLGRPWLAFRAFLGWRTSWLSREAIAFGVYMFVSGVAALGFVVEQEWLGHWMPKMMLLDFLARSSLLLALTSAMIGLVAVGCSAMIYVATQRKLWNARRSFTEFFAATGGLGLGLMAVVGGASISPKMLALGAGMCGLGAIAKSLDRWRGQATEQEDRTQHWSDFSARSGRLLANELSLPWRMMWLGWVIAIILVSLLQTEMIFSKAGGPVAWLVLVLLVGSQLINRWLYFASIVTHRMPGASS